MAKTPAERMREMRERKKQAAIQAEKALAPAIYQQAFSDFMEGRGFPDHHLILGNSWWNFSNDDGIELLSDDALDADEMRNASNSLGKAELILNVLGDIATTLAADVNAYKKKEISNRIAEIETSDLSDPDTRKKALADIVRLKKMLDQLDKQVRWSFPQWEVTGD